MRNTDQPAAESAYIVTREISAHAIASSLQALLPTRHHLIARHRFTLLDTFDGRIRRAGARLTVSGARGTSKLAWQTGAGASDVTVGLQQPVGFAWDLPDGPLQQAVESVIGPRRLLPQADAEEAGSLLEVLDEREKTVARVRIASTHARLPMPRASWQPLPTTVTLTGLRGYEGDYGRLVPLVESRPGIESCPDGVTGLMLRRIGAPIRGSLSLPYVDLESTVRADAGARQLHRALLEILALTEPGLRADVDTEFLHDFRVAVRRTRALVRQIRHVFPPAIVEHFSNEFSWIGRLTGPPRDVDVLHLALRHRGAEFRGGAIDAVLGCLRQMQQQQHDRLVEALDSDRYRLLISDWSAFLARPVGADLDARNAGEPLVELVSRRAWRLSRRIASAAGTIDEDSAAECLHQLRIDAKKLRYLIDVVSAFYDAADIECILGALKKLQRVLGDFNDAHVQETLLLECARSLRTAGPQVLATLGRLVGQSRQHRARLRGEIAERLERFRDHDTSRACRRAFRTAEPTE